MLDLTSHQVWRTFCLIRGNVLSRSGSISEELRSFLKPLERLLVDRKHASQGAPFSGHVGDSEPLVDAQLRYSGSHKLDGMVENFVFVEQTAQSDDDVLACCILGKGAVQFN